MKNDGSLELNPEYFDFLSSERITNENFDRLFGGGPRAPTPGLRGGKWTSPARSRR